MDDMSLWEDYRKAMQEELNVEIEMFDNDQGGINGKADFNEN